MALTRMDSSDRNRNADPIDNGKDSRPWLFGVVVASIAAAGLLAYLSFGV